MQDRKISFGLRNTIQRKIQDEIVSVASLCNDPSEARLHGADIFAPGWCKYVIIFVF
jgi:hypothetical protein